MKPVESLDPKRIERLPADLGSDRFAVREAASQELLGLDQRAIPYLEASLSRHAYGCWCGSGFSLG
jgi:hypothetical protein